MDWQGPQVSKATRLAAADGLREASEFLLGESLKVVPREEAILAASGATDVDPVSMRATVSFDTPYAARQHEELTWRHRPGQTAKYLERPLEQNQQRLQEIIARTIGRTW
jgi:hypothetical protein